MQIIGILAFVIKQFIVKEERIVFLRLQLESVLARDGRVGEGVKIFVLLDFICYQANIFRVDVIHVIPLFCVIIDQCFDNGSKTVSVADKMADIYPKGTILPRKRQ